MAIAVSTNLNRKFITAAEVLRAANNQNVGLFHSEKKTVSSLFKVLNFEDNRASDYRVYFNAASFDNADDAQEIQFIYVGYINEKKSLQLSIGSINGDKLSLKYGSLVEIKDGNYCWLKGGEFTPPITAKTSMVTGRSQATLRVISEDDFLATSLEYIHKFEEIALVELNDSKAG
ncbi:hypothetical protein OIV19_18380 [Brucella sp. HL-2]|nr:hypothetical protein [Brucella sp. HL-2]MCV9909571.1 hypothetical protein [Brucella sp. HL-2]